MIFFLSKKKEEEYFCKLEHTGDNFNSLLCIGNKENTCNSLLSH